MIDRNRWDDAGIKNAFKFLAESVGEIGWSVPPSAWTSEQVEAVCEAIITGWQEGYEQARQSGEAPF
jgi:hypothetical protein